MADVHSKARRSYNMSRVRSTGNRTTELSLVELLRQWHITGWRRGSTLFGRPDFVFSSARLAVFVDGCFWHNCLRCGFKPASNVKYWTAKFARNGARDAIVNRTLKLRGWSVMRIWEHGLRNPARVKKRLQRLLAEAN
jgi:DNA mismatch endonuclease (patch repair protein)